MNKPISIQTEELKKNIIEIINNANLPSFIINFIMKDIYMEINSVYQQQLQKDIENYNASLEKETDEK